MMAKWQHRIIESLELEKTFKGHLVQLTCHEQGHLQLNQVAQISLNLNISRDGPSTLGNLFHCFTKCGRIMREICEIVADPCTLWCSFPGILCSFRQWLHGTLSICFLLMPGCLFSLCPPSLTFRIQLMTSSTVIPFGTALSLGWRQEKIVNRILLFHQGVHRCLVSPLKELSVG